MTRNSEKEKMNMSRPGRKLLQDTVRHRQSTFATSRVGIAASNSIRLLAYAIHADLTVLCAATIVRNP